MAPETVQSYMSSTFVHLRVPPANPDEDEKVYTAHRKLISARTTILQSANTNTHQNIITLPESISSAGVLAMLDFLYTGQYLVSESPPGYDELNSEREESPVSTQSPVVKAAMKGAIGVWGKPGALQDSLLNQNMSSYSSELFPAISNGYATPPQCGEDRLREQSPVSSPPTFPENGEEPVLRETSGPSTAVENSANKSASTPSYFANHIRVYEVACKYEVQGLSGMALNNIEKLVVENPKLLRNLVSVAYGEEGNSEELKKFAVRLLYQNREKLSTDKVYSDLLSEGGPFVVDYFSYISI